MRLFTGLLLFCALLMTACGGAPSAPTDAPLPTMMSIDLGGTATADAAATAAVQQPIPTVGPRDYELTGVADIPLPGTLVYAATEDPNMGVTFDSIYFERTGGTDGPLTMEVRGDGTVVRNGEAIAPLNSVQVGQITSLIDEINFFNILGVFTAAGTSPNAVQYSITVDRGGSSSSIQAVRELAPRQLIRLFQLLEGIGVIP